MAERQLIGLAMSELLHTVLEAEGLIGTRHAGRRPKVDLPLRAGVFAVGRDDVDAEPAHVGHDALDERNPGVPNRSLIGRSARNSSASELRMRVRSVPRSSLSTLIVRFVACESLSMGIICDCISSAWKTTSLSPRAMRSPGRRGTGSAIFTPFTSVPFTLPQSRTNHCPRSRTISAWRRERKRSLIGIVQSDARPRVIMSPGMATCCGAIPG